MSLMTQLEAMSILKTGRNVFITGPAGSGKTHLLNQYIKYLRDHNVKIGITASTGIAATHMGGMTLHSWSQIGIKDRFAKGDIDDLLGRSYLKKRLKDVSVLIIDEISMLHGFQLDMVDEILKAFKKSEQPFGGIQVVFCGDFFQLPPISSMNEPVRFAYHSRSWKEAKPAVCYLKENYRQKDNLSLSVLNGIRSGMVSDSIRKHIESRLNCPTSSAEPTRLYTHNIDVDMINNRELSKMDEYEYLYEMESKGRPYVVESLKRSCLAPDKLRLKKGARVMCVKNNFESGYVNGSLGVVASCGPNVDPVVLLSNGNRVTIERQTWVIEDEGKTLAEICQYPLRLAWAITVHKSQGMSLDAVEVDLSKSFEPGMGYVALSRVRTIEGLNILGFNEMSLKVNPEVLEYDKYLRSLSAKEENLLMYTTKDELELACHEFLARSASMYGLTGKKKRGKIKSKKKIDIY